MGATAPRTLLECVRMFEDKTVAFEFFKELRWPNGPVCPDCGCSEYSFIKTRFLFKCKACKKQYSVKMGTVLEESPLGLDKWLPAIWLITNTKNGTSSHELGRALGVTQRTAWFMLHRIREAMKTGTFEKLKDVVEVDETFVGGKAKNMHKEVRERKITGTGGKDKAVVFGMMERGGDVRAYVVSDRTRATVQGEIAKNVDPGAKVYTDSFTSYNGLNRRYRHDFVDHNAIEFVRGDVHTNGIENFWALFKRCLKGTYISVLPCHLDAYLVEESFRFNERRLVDGERFRQVVGQVSGKRVTYRELTARGR